MKTTHVDDQHIQQFIFDIDTCDNNVITHINSCDVCQEIADSYTLLSIDLKEQKAPVLSFNLEDRILQQITHQVEQEQRSKKYSFTGPIISIIFGIIAILSNTFIGELRNLLDLKDLSTYFIVSIGIFITTLLSIDVVRLFKSKMHKINFS